MHFLSAKSASLGVFDRKFRGKEQQEKPRVREFRELWIASLRELSVDTSSIPIFFQKESLEKMIKQQRKFEMISLGSLYKKLKSFV